MVYCCVAVNAPVFQFDSYRCIFIKANREPFDLRIDFVLVDVVQLIESTLRFLHPVELPFGGIVQVLVAVHGHRHTVVEVLVRYPCFKSTRTAGNRARFDLVPIDLAFEFSKVRCVDGALCTVVPVFRSSNLARVVFPCSHPRRQVFVHRIERQTPFCAGLHSIV